MFDSIFCHSSGSYCSALPTASFVWQPQLSVINRVTEARRGEHLGKLHLASICVLCGVFRGRFATGSLHQERIEILFVFHWKNLTTPALCDLKY